MSIFQKLNFLQPAQKTGLKSPFRDRIGAAFAVLFGKYEKKEAIIDIINGKSSKEIILVHIGLFDILTVGMFQLAFFGVEKLNDLSGLCFTGATKLFPANTRSLAANILLFILKLPILLPLLALGIVFSVSSNIAWLAHTLSLCLIAVVAMIAAFPIILVVHGIMKAVVHYQENKSAKAIQKQLEVHENELNDQTSNAQKLLKESPLQFIPTDVPKEKENPTNVQEEKENPTNTTNNFPETQQETTLSPLLKKSQFQTTSVNTKSDEGCEEVVEIECQN